MRTGKRCKFQVQVPGCGLTLYRKCRQPRELKLAKNSRSEKSRSESSELKTQSSVRLRRWLDHDGIGLADIRIVNLLGVELQVVLQH
jgi:hypothetical protein